MDLNASEEKKKTRLNQKENTEPKFDTITKKINYVDNFLKAQIPKEFSLY